MPRCLSTLEPALYTARGLAAAVAGQVTEAGVLMSVPCRHVECYSGILKPFACKGRHSAVPQAAVLSKCRLPEGESGMSTITEPRTKFGAAG